MSDKDVRDLAAAVEKVCEGMQEALPYLYAQIQRIDGVLVRLMKELDVEWHDDEGE